MAKEDKIIIDADLFYPKGKLLKFLLVFVLSIAFGFLLPFFLGKSDWVFTLAAFMMFAPAFVYLYFAVQKNEADKSQILFDSEHFEVLKNGVGFLSIDWANIEKYAVLYPQSPFSARRRYIIDIKKRTGGRNSISVVDGNLLNLNTEIRQNSVLDIFCNFVARYNQHQISNENRIRFQEGLFSKKTFKYLFILPIAFILFDIFYRISHPNIGFRFDSMILLFVLLSTLGSYLRLRQYARFNEAVLKLHNRNAIE